MSRLESSNRLYRVVADPDGRRYEIAATDAFGETAGAPSLLFLFLTIRAIFRRLREQSWEITVREAGQAHRLVTTKFAGDRAAAEAVVADLAGIITTDGVDNLHQ